MVSRPRKRKCCTTNGKLSLSRLSINGLPNPNFDAASTRSDSPSTASTSGTSVTGSSNDSGFQSRRPTREACEPPGPSFPRRLDYGQVSRALLLSGDELLLTMARESYGFLELLKRVGSGAQELVPNFMLIVFGVLVKTLCPSSTEDGERVSVQPVSYSDASATRNKLVGEAIQSRA